MGKYNDWKLGQIEALINIIGGDEVARAVLSGECGIIVEPKEPPLPVQKPPKLPLVGTVVKTLYLKPDRVKSFKKGIKRGKYNTQSVTTGYSPRKFTHDEVDLIEPVSVDLIQFNQRASYDEMLVWAKENGGKVWMQFKHLFAIGIQHTEEQRGVSIMAIGSEDPNAYGAYEFSSGQRHLYKTAKSGTDWSEISLFGLLNDQPVST